MTTTLNTSSSSIAMDPAAPTAGADGAVADHSAHIAGELAIVRPDRHRDDTNMLGHRISELTPGQAAA